MANKLYWKYHATNLYNGGLPYEIIEFFNKDTSKVLKVDSLSWESSASEIINWVSENWEGIKTSMDSCDIMIEVH